MNARHFPDFISAYLEYTKGHEATERCHLWSIISVIAAALERRVYMDRGYYTLFPNLYVFIVGRSGLIKKSTTTGIAVDLLRDLPAIKMMSERLTAASLISQLHRSGSAYQFKGQKIRQSCLFTYASELAVVLQEVHGTILELLTTFYDCVPNDSSKPWIYDTKTSGTMKIYGPCLNILAATTKPWLKKCLPSAEMEGGFTSRVVFVVENNPPTNLVAWPEVDTALLEHKKKLLSDLRRIFCLAGSMHVAPEARKLFTDWYTHHMTSVVPYENDPRFAGYNGRKGDLLLKLSMVRSVSKRETLEVLPEDLVWAGEQLEIIEPEMRQAFEGVGMNRSGEITFEILRFIQKKGVADRGEIKRLFMRDASGIEVDRSLQDLLDMKELEIFEDIVGNERKQKFRPTKYNIVDKL